VLLVRHARAGDSAAWKGDDRLRPLDDRGRRQADALVDLLAPFAIERIVSSPYQRCLETVEPLARSRGLRVELRTELAADRQDAEAGPLLRVLVEEDAVVCVHGGVESGLLPDGARFPKGSAWRLTADGAPPRYLAPPA
jgi:8-oxo-(d)GTP phosphatase